MKKIITILLILVLCISMVGSGIYFYITNKDNIKTNGIWSTITNKTGKTSKSEKLIDDWQYSSKDVYDGMKNYSSISIAESAVSDSTIGLSVGGAKNINNFRENIENGYFPILTDITYNGIYNDGKCDGTNNTINNYVEGNTYNTVADYRGQYNRNNNDNAYVGYTYGTAGSTSFDATHYDTQNNSDIKSAVEDFYFRNTSLYKYTEFGYGYDAGGVDTGTSTDDILLASRYEEVEDVVYCNDRQYECVEVSTIPDEKPCGYSTKSTNYGYKTQKDMVTYICPKFYDKYMLDDGYAGGSDDVTNLNFAVALPTASEIIMAGGSLSENNDGYFLKSGSGYWTMSPSSFDGTAKVYSVDGNGKVVPTDVNTQLGIRPVISIESEVGVSYGSGLADEPYMLN